jgi:hypothetical protein
MPLTRRILLAACIGLVAAIITAPLSHAIIWQGERVGDIGPALGGMHAWLHGEPAYGFTADGDPLVSNPFTTMIVVGPLLLLPLPLAAPVFMGISSALLAFGLLREGEYWRLLVFTSLPYAHSLVTVQWAPLFAAALLLPPLLVLAPVKPQLGLVLLAAGRWNRRLLLATALFVLLSLLLYPAWPLDFFITGELTSYEGQIPALIGPGLLVPLLALLCWREPNARLLAAMALVPQRLWYDQLLLFLIPRSWQTLLLLSVCSWFVWAFTVRMGLPLSIGFAPLTWLSIVLGLYLPALGILLWSERAHLAHLYTTTARRLGARA